jgi:hypothetical protein
VSNQAKCPACVIRVIDRMRPGGRWRDPSCTGRPGCVRHPNRENPAPDSAPAGAGVPDGKADIVDRLRQGTVMADVRWPGDNSPPVDEYETDALMAEAAAEIARLQAEVERLQADRAALAHRVAEAVREACAAVAATHSRRSSLTNYNFTANTRDDQAAMAAAAFVHDEIVAIDLDTIVAAAIKKEGER